LKPEEVKHLKQNKYRLTKRRRYRLRPNKYRLLKPNRLLTLKKNKEIKVKELILKQSSRRKTSKEYSKAFPIQCLNFPFLGHLQGRKVKRKKIM